MVDSINTSILKKNDFCEVGKKQSNTLPKGTGSIVGIWKQEDVKMSW